MLVNDAMQSTASIHHNMAWLIVHSWMVEVGGTNNVAAKSGGGKTHLDDVMYS